MTIEFSCRQPRGKDGKVVSYCIRLLKCTFRPVFLTTHSRFFCSIGDCFETAQQDQMQDYCCKIHLLSTITLCSTILACCSSLLSARASLSRNRLHFSRQQRAKVCVKVASRVRMRMFMRTCFTWLSLSSRVLLGPLPQWLQLFLEAENVSFRAGQERLQSP